DLTTAPTASTEAVKCSPVDEYAITAAGGVSDKYEVDYVEGKLEITTATIYVSAIDGEKYCGQADPSLEYYYSPELVCDNNFTGELERDSGESVGTYKILQGTLA